MAECGPPSGPVGDILGKRRVTAREVWQSGDSRRSRRPVRGWTGAPLRRGCARVPESLGLRSRGPTSMSDR
ncbi:hypothetical protein NDU88_009232 [Pleurodeles waltl]|uniref:Uncharacterized protein n=1 Tax=Pleurodeles waltl TaxID=8319 RepID=A0AAV7QSE3_PLEWA|nr:hypothetical protein NDU88_009232 [Pleurodeles waltl]